MTPLLRLTPQGLYCPPGRFHIDPWRPVEHAVITHAHADHARPGSRHYLTSTLGHFPLAARMADDADIETLDYGETIYIGEHVKLSLHPAGHLLGSSQIRIEHDGEVVVVTGDYKRQHDPTCQPFEVVRCDTLITESTFGLPVYRWPDPQDVAKQINLWWRDNLSQNKTSILYTYALGKAQRVLAMLDPQIGPILVHGSILKLVEAYRSAGVTLPDVLHADKDNARAHKGRAMVIATPGNNGTTWIRKFQPFDSAFVSGWMHIRGARRRRAVDRGFVLSDHVDWPGLMQTIEETGARHIGVTHGYAEPVVRHLQDQGRDAFVVPTRFAGESDDM